MKTILSAYFTGRPDPQFLTSGVRSSKQWQPNDPRLLSQWVPGLVRLGLYGVIFHNGCSPRFCEENGTGKIHFHKCKPKSIPRDISFNDYRFTAWLDWLKEHEKCEACFCTDLFDVAVVKDPFEIMDGRHELWAACEPHKVRDSWWMCRKYMEVFGKVPTSRDARILNAGIFGGYRTPMLEFLVMVTEEIRRRKKRAFNTNMAVYNYCLQQRFGMGRVWANGPPLHSVFKKFQVNRKDVYFIHK